MPLADRALPHGDSPGPTVSRSLAAGIIISIVLHGVLLVLLLYATQGKGLMATKIVARHGQAAFEVALIPAGAERSATASPPVAAGSPTQTSQASVATPASAVSSPVTRSVAVPDMADANAPIPGAPSPTNGQTAIDGLTTIDPAQMAEYRRRLLSHIWSRRAPVLAAGRRADRPAMIRFLLDRSGQVQSVEMVSSSGEAGIDDEAIAAIWRALPMPPIPNALPGHLLVTLPVAIPDALAARAAN